MGLSWSAMRKELEQENICDSLKGRILYFATRYRKSHDQEGRVAIRLDGIEIFNACFYHWLAKRDAIVKSSVVSKEQVKSKGDYWEKYTWKQ